MNRVMAVPGLVPRVDDALRLDTGDPLVVLFGSGVSDMFVGVDYQERALDESLWHVLRTAGFQRIVFRSANKPVYFLDRYSRDPAAVRAHSARRLVRDTRGSAAGSAGPEPCRDTATGGRGSPSWQMAAMGAETESHRAAVRQRDPDWPGMQALDACMRMRDTPTAVVIVQAEHFLRSLGAEQGPAGWFTEWPQASMDNICVLVFSSTSWDGTVNFVRSLGRMNALVSFMEQQGSRPHGRGVGEIGKPDAAEIERIIHVARLRHGLRIGDWGELSRIVAALAAQPGVPAATWARRLWSLARSGTVLSEAELRSRQWVEVQPSGRPAWDRLTELIGLAEVKEHVDRLRWRAEAESRRRREGLLRDSASLHLVFTGRPGTGKTTVARLIGELYREMGLLRRGHLHAPEAADLVGMYVGHTATQTNRAVDAALDGVLFIDEAYRLSEQPGGFGQEAIDTLVTRMENERDRLVVVVAGYPSKMDAFLRSNPGLPRRFPRGNIISFPDYDPPALLAILFGMLRDRGLHWVPALEPVLEGVVTSIHAVRDETFGNAGEMRNLAQEMETNWARRVRAVISEPVTPDDLPEAYRRYA